MPNIPFFGYQNSLSLEAYLEIMNKIQGLEKKVSDLENEIKVIKNKKGNTIYEYQTSMNMI